MRILGDHAIFNEDCNKHNDGHRGDGDHKPTDKPRLLLLLLRLSDALALFKPGNNLLRPARSRLLLRLGKHCFARQV